MNEEVSLAVTTLTALRLVCSDKDERTERRYTKWEADVTLDEAKGRISVHSTYGEYHDTWPSFDARGRRSLAAFLAGCGDDYILQNFNHGYANWLDLEATKKTLKRMILAIRRRRRKWHEYAFDFDLDKYQARECWDHIESLDDEDIRSIDAYWREVYGRGALGQYIFHDPHSVICVTDYEPKIRKFMEVIWPEIRKALRSITSNENQRAEKEEATCSDSASTLS